MGRGARATRLSRAIAFPGPHYGPLGSSLTHRRPLSAAICPFRGRAGREPAIGVAISRFSRAMHAPPTMQTNRKPPSPLHPSPDWRPTARLRPTSLGPAPRRGRPAPPDTGCARRSRASVDALSNESPPSAEKEGVGTARGAAPPPVGTRLVVGSRGNHGSFPPPAPPTPPAWPIARTSQRRAWPDAVLY